MVFPRAREKRSLAKFLATLCAVNALFLALPSSCSAEHPQQLSAGNALRVTRNLDAQLFVQNADGSPATWVDDGEDPTRPSLSAVSITSTESVIPIYGPDESEPLFHTPDDPAMPSAVDTAAPVAPEEPMVLMSPTPVDGSDTVIDTPQTDNQVPLPVPPPAVLEPPATPAPVTPTPADPTVAETPAPADPTAPESPSPAPTTTTDDTSGATTVVITLPGDDPPITVTIPDSANPTPAPTVDTTADWSPSDPTPTPTDTGSQQPAVVVVFTPSTNGTSPVVSPATGGDNGGEQTFEPMVIFDDSTPTAAPTVTVPSGETLGGGEGEQTSEPMIIIFDDGTPAPMTPVAPGSDVSPYLFATKTAYWDQRDLYPDDNMVQLTKRMAEMQLSELTLLQVQQVNRHGTRFPTKGDTEDILSLLTKLQSDHAELLPEWLQSYSPPYNVTVDGVLAPPGAVELQDFGARTRESVGEALPIEFAEDNFVFQHTYKSRTKDSATSFASSFFTNPEDVKYTEHSKKKDRLLRFFDECPRYTADVKDNVEAHAEVAAFKRTPQMAEYIALLKSRLNLPETANITQVDLETAYTACAFDIALYGTYLNWCTLLDKNLATALDYAEDLENYFEKGGGFQINYEIASVLLKDIFTYMKALIDGTTKVVGNFRFAHAETTLPLMTLLGYGDRTPLLASYTADQIAFRGFRTSVLAPMAANIDFRLYQSKANATQYFVQVLVNEKVAPVPGCDGQVFCELTKVEELWGYYLNDYNFDDDCKVAEA
ncbi:hypothetical protein Gpo141_00003269 [Globisporangium polare]